MNEMCKKTELYNFYHSCSIKSTDKEFDQLTDDKKIMVVAKEILEKYKEAFIKLAE